MQKFGIRTAGRSLFLCLVALTFMALAQSEARVADYSTGQITLQEHERGPGKRLFTGVPFAHLTTVTYPSAAIRFRSRLKEKSVSLV